MNWQVKYALENLGQPGGGSTAEHVRGEAIRIFTPHQPDALAVISAAETIDKDLAVQVHKEEPCIDFLCGYRKTCVWEGGAIAYLEGSGIGWGNFGTLCSSVREGKAKSAAHKDFVFSDRLIRQYGLVDAVEREFDRVYRLNLKNGRRLRIGLIADYEPTADGVRSFWDRFGPVNVVWNINPNGSPTQKALEAGIELGCEVLKWDGLKEYLKKP